MKRATAFLLALLVLAAPSAFAQACDTSGYKGLSYDTPTSIPDNFAPGVLIGPIATTGNALIADVILDVDIVHSWAGDIEMTLYYDQNCDGVENPDLFATGGGADDVRAPVFCQMAGACEQTSNCPADFAGNYTISDAGAPFPEDQCPLGNPFPLGCYLQDTNSLVQNAAGFTVFDGLMKGGCFWLFVSDLFALDTGSVRSWGLSLFNDPGTPVETMSWGEIKSAYR